MPELETFTGEVVMISPRFWRDGWGFATIRDNGRDIPIVGTLEGTTLGMRVVVTGAWEKHPKYGARVQATTIVADLPGSKDGIEAWLIQTLPQIGPIRAQEISELFGDMLWEVLENAHYKLEVISGITPMRALEIRNAYLTFKEEREAFIEFYSMGLTKREAQQARKMGEDAVQQIAENPWLLYFRSGFTFGRTDYLAQQMQKPLTFGPRMVAAVVEAVRRVSRENGDTAVTEHALVAEAGSIIDDRTLNNHLVAAIRQAHVDGHLVNYKDHWMLKMYAEAEATIAEKILEMTRNT